jgi:hypothetical protein
LKRHSFEVDACTSWNRIDFSKIQLACVGSVLIFLKNYLVLGLCDPIDPFVTIVLSVCLMASHKWWYVTQVYSIPKSISLSLSLKISWKNQDYDSFGLSQILLSLVNVGSNSTLYLLSKHSMEIKDHIHYCWKGVFRIYRHLSGTIDKSSLSKILKFLGTTDTTSVLPIWRLWRKFFRGRFNRG